MSQYTFDFQDALKKGYTPDQINQFLSQQQKQGNSYQLTNVPQQTPQQSQQPAPAQGNWFTDALPTIGGVVGGVAGAAIPGLGETGIGEIGGAAAGSGLGETIKELITGQKLNARDIGTQTVLGGAGGVVGKGISAVAGKVLPKLADGTAGRLMNSVYKEPIKATKAATAAGKTLGQEALDRGQVGSTRDLFDAANTQIQNNESSLQSLLMNTDKKVSMDDVRKTVQPLIDKYTSSGNTTAADALKKRLADIESANGTQIPAASANEIKRSLYDEVNNAYGAQSTPNTEGTKAVARGLKEALEPIPGVSQINKDLSFFGRQRNSMLDKMTRDERNNVLGLTDAIIGGGGVALGPAGIIPAAGAIAAKKVLGSPLVKTATAQGLHSIASSPLAATAGNIAAQTTGQSGARGLLPAGPEGNTQQQQSNNIDQNTLPPSPQDTSNSTIPSPTSQPTPSANPLEGYTLNGKPLDPATANLIYKVATYQLDPTKMASLKNNERERLISIVSQFDPTYDSSQFPVKQKVREDFATGKAAQNVKAINTAIGHLSELAQTGNELNNSSLPLLNEVKNAFQTGTGSSKANNFETDADAVAGEMSNIFKATGGTDSEIAAWRKHFRSDMSPAQQAGVIQKAVALMAGRLQALQSQYTQGLGKPAQHQFLDPSSEAILKKFGIDPTSLTTQGQ